MITEIIRKTKTRKRTRTKTRIRIKTKIRTRKRILKTTTSVLTNQKNAHSLYCGHFFGLMILFYVKSKRYCLLFLLDCDKMIMINTKEIWLDNK